MNGEHWNGLCSAGLHGLDYESQACDLCVEMSKRAPAMQHAAVAYHQPFRDRAYCVACSECGADPLQGCSANSGRSRSRPHGKRVARSNGLRPTPRRGCFARPTGGIQFTETEIKAFQTLGFPIPG